MSKAQISMWEEKIVDSFAGGGGASTGIELATARVVDIAINHDPDAILMHKTNHPHTVHYQASVWDVDPLEVTGGSPVGLLWASPDCKHFSKAKGGKPVDKNIRGLAWIVLRWAGTVRPRVVILENVEEFQTWGPVRRGHPVKAKAGRTFRRFIDQLEGLPQWVILGAETGNRADKVAPRREWVDQITQFCAENEIPVFYKDNLRAHFPDLPPSASPWDDREDATAEWAAHYMGRFERQV